MENVTNAVCSVLNRFFPKTATTSSTNEESRVRGTPGMIELEQEDPIPQGDLALQITALPAKPTALAIFSAAGW